MSAGQSWMDREEHGVGMGMEVEPLQWVPRSRPTASHPQEVQGGQQTGSAHPQRRYAWEASLRRRLQQAADWIDLSALMDDVDRNYREGLVSTERAEELAREVGERSHHLPEVHGD